MIRIGVVGYGYWGPNLVRNFGETRGASVVAVADLDRSKLALLARRYPAIKLTTDLTELLSDPNIDAIAWGTPVHTHYELGLAALRAGSNLGREPPMTRLWRKRSAWSTKRTPPSDAAFSTIPSSTPRRRQDGRVDQKRRPGCIRTTNRYA